jgi:hypothetical protein
VVSAAACALALGCGGDDPDPEAAVVWINLVQGTTNQCDRTTSLQLPDNTAPTTIQGQVSGSTREEDGAGSTVVDCRVRATTGGAFEIALQLRSPPDVRLLSLSGTVAQGAGQQVRVSLQSDQVGALAQQVCDAQVEVVRDGAIWIRSLDCSDLTDDRSPSTHCAATGGVLFERCQG